MLSKNRHRRPTKIDLFLWLLGFSTGVLATRGTAWKALRKAAEAITEEKKREHQLRRRVVKEMDLAKIGWMQALREKSNEVPSWMADKVEEVFDDIAIQVQMGKL